MTGEKPVPSLSEDQRRRLVLVSRLVKSIPTEGEVRVVLIVSGPIKGDDETAFLTSSCNCCEACRDSLVHMMSAALEGEEVECQMH